MKRENRYPDIDFINVKVSHWSSQCSRIDWDDVIPPPPPGLGRTEETVDLNQHTAKLPRFLLSVKEEETGTTVWSNPCLSGAEKEA